MVVDVLSDWAMRDPEPGPHRRIHLHFLENPVEILGADGAVVGLRTERQELTGDGTVRGTGEFTDWDVQAVYRAVGYRSEAIEDLPFDTRRFVLPNDGGRVLDLDGDAAARALRDRLGQARPGRPDRAHQVRRRRDRRQPARRRCRTCRPRRTATGRRVDALLAAKGLPVTDFAGWDRLDAHELAAGAAARPGPDQGHLPRRDDGDRRPRRAPTRGSTRRRG